MAFKVLRRNAIAEGLTDQTRQYLAGNLQRPQILDFIKDSDLEIGISNYPGSSYENAHVHTQAKEYHYVICGMTEYMDLDDESIYQFSSGDFYIIYPGTRYIQRIKQDTQIFFIKYPSGNDKEEIDCPEHIAQWAQLPLCVTRIDHTGDGGAPRVNSMRPAAAAAILNSNKHLLLVKRRDSGLWSMPGGTMEMNESLEKCIIREVFEETGLAVTIKGIIGTYTDPANIVSYSDGEVRREFSIVFSAQTNFTDFKIDHESTQAAWVPLENLLSYSFAHSQRKGLEDVIEYYKSGSVFIR